MKAFKEIPAMAESAESSLYYYYGCSYNKKAVSEETISDLISDLLHLADQNSIDWEKVMRMSMNKFIGEKFSLGFGYRGVLNAEDK